MRDIDRNRRPPVPATPERGVGSGGRVSRYQALAVRCLACSEWWRMLTFAQRSEALHWLERRAGLLGIPEQVLEPECL